MGSVPILSITRIGQETLVGWCDVEEEPPLWGVMRGSEGLSRG